MEPLLQYTMGLTNGGLMLYLAEVSFENLVTVLRHRAAPKNRDPCVYLDGNWLVRKLAPKNGGMVAAIPSILCLLKSFASQRIVAKLVVDNRSLRHHSKKATIQRDAAAEQARLDSYII